MSASFAPYQSIPPASLKDGKGTDFARKFVTMAVGNMMEWFDFSSFGALIDIIGDKFFPSQNAESSLLIALIIFGLAFVMRPLGGLLIGWIGDTIGRKRALEVSIGLMLLPSFLIGCLPTYDQAGWISPCMLTILRCMQGLAAGGEEVGAFIYVLEAADEDSMGFWGGACKATANLGTALGVGLVAILRVSLHSSAMHQWGWRLPFWAGLLFGAVGLWLRTSLEQDPIQQTVNHKDGDAIEDRPVSVVCILFKKQIFIITCVVAFWSVGFYSSCVWMAYYMGNDHLSGGVQNVWSLMFAVNLLVVLALPLGGWCGDWLGKTIMHSVESGTRIAMLVAILLMILVVFPAYILIISATRINVAVGLVLLVIPVALYGGNVPAFMLRQFPTKQRYTGIGIAYNMSTAIFASTTSIILTSLVTSKTGIFATTSNGNGVDRRLRPVFYILLVCILSACALSAAKDYEAVPKACQSPQDDEEQSKIDPAEDEDLPREVSSIA